MDAALQALQQYAVRVAPGLVLAALVFALVRRERLLRIVLYVALFIFLRDAMTPLGLWSFGREGGFWIRLTAPPLFLFLFAASCLAISIALYWFDHENRPLFAWKRGGVLPGLLWGIGGALVVVAPCAIAYQSVPIALRGGPVPPYTLPAILIFALLGNLLEEALFRGYVFGQLALNMTLLKAAVASGIIFSFCHIYLATTVTAIGLPLLIFTLWEGTIAGIVGAKCGVLFSTLTHGGAIFLLASGLL
jgi:CAAX protease family protein